MLNDINLFVMLVFFTCQAINTTMIIIVVKQNEQNKKEKEKNDKYQSLYVYKIEQNRRK